MSIAKWRIKINRSTKYYEVFPPNVETSLGMIFTGLDGAWDYVDYRLEMIAENHRISATKDLVRSDIWIEAFSDVGAFLFSGTDSRFQCSTSGPDSQADEYPEELTNYNTL